MKLASPAHRVVSPAAGRVPHVVVVDPNFERYGALIASERQGRITLHLRSSGRDALRLLDREDIDAWIVGTDLDDMSGHDFAELLRVRLSDARIGIVSDAETGDHGSRIMCDDSRSVGADAALEHPISFRQLDTLLGMSAAERSKVFPATAAGSDGIFASLQIGLTAAAAAVAVLIMC
jgi:DNA-binding response OmpR family regulator